MRWLGLTIGGPIAGAIVCTMLDHLHATHGVLVYRSPDVWSQAWWVPLEFAVATFVAISSARPFVRELTRPSMLLVLVDIVCFAAAYALTSLMPADMATTTLLILLVSFGLRVVIERVPAMLVLSCVGLAIGGVTCEGLLSRTGAFHYLHPDVFGTPRWLAAIYLHVGIVTGRLAVALR